jgi:uncharacterized protein
MQPRLNVVTLGVSDFARSVRFYQDLGFERRFKSTGDEIAFDDAQLPAEPRPQGFRGVTLAKLCRTDKCVDAFMTRALAAGATLLKHAQKTAYGGYSGYVADPDGHAWEAVRAPGFEFAADGRVSLPE